MEARFTLARATVDKIQASLDGAGPTPDPLRDDLRETVRAFHLDLADVGLNPPVDHLEKGKSNLRLAQFAFLRGDLSTAGWRASKALTCFQVASEPAAYAEALDLRGVIDTRFGDWEEAESHLNESITLCRSLTPSVAFPARIATIEAQSHHNLGVLFVSSGRRVEALGEFTRAASMLAEKLARDHDPESMHTHLQSTSSEPRRFFTKAFGRMDDARARR